MNVNLFVQSNYDKSTYIDLLMLAAEQEIIIDNNQVLYPLATLLGCDDGLTVVVRY